MSTNHRTSLVHATPKTVLRTVQAAFAAGFVLAATPALAESEPMPALGPQVTAELEAPSLGAEPVVLVPIGDADDFGLGVGGGAHITYHRPMGVNLALTGRSGITYHTTDADETSVFVVPILAGARYYFGPNHAGTYVGGEAGLFWGRVSGEVLGQSVSDSDTELGAAFSGGVRLSNLDLRAGIQFYSIDDIDESMILFGTASFKIASL